MRSFSFRFNTTLTNSRWNTVKSVRCCLRCSTEFPLSLGSLPFLAGSSLSCRTHSSCHSESASKTLSLSLASQRFTSPLVSGGHGRSRPSIRRLGESRRRRRGKVIRFSLSLDDARRERNVFRLKSSGEHMLTLLEFLTALPEEVTRLASLPLLISAFR